MSIASRVNERLKRMKRGVPFPISRFYALGSHTAVQKVMSRLVQKGIIDRVAKGFYARPKSLPSFPELKISASGIDLAQVWAKAHSYKLASQGFEAAYRLGLQTQAPVRTIFWSNGPARKFQIGYEVVQVRHVSKTKLKWAGTAAGELLRGLMTIPPTSADKDKALLLKAFKRLSLSVSEIQAVITKLVDNPLLKAWRERLIQVEQFILTA